MVRREEKIHSNESGDNMHKWNEITDENSLKEFMERVSFFHDSCIKEMHYLSGAYVNENLDMYPVNDRRNCENFTFHHRRREIFHDPQ